MICGGKWAEIVGRGSCVATTRDSTRLAHQGLRAPSFSCPVETEPLCLSLTSRLSLCLGVQVIANAEIEGLAVLAAELGAKAAVRNVSIRCCVPAQNACPDIYCHVSLCSMFLLLCKRNPLLS